MFQSFETTSWSMVLSAREDASEARDAALSQLCERYWPPIYTYLRGRGFDTESAKDLTQDFFSHLLGRDFLANVDTHRGRFRSFLLASVGNFLKDEGKRITRQKRGGGAQHIPLDSLDAESLYAWHAAHDTDPALLFDRQWAQTLLETAIERLEDEFSASGRSSVFAVLKGNLVPHAGEAPHRLLAERLGMSEGSVRVTLHRMRKRYGAILREEIGRTVESETQVEEELRYLMEVVGR